MDVTFHGRILALGSPHGDDRVAWQVAERLGQVPSLHGCVVALASPWDLLDHLNRDTPVILLDACQPEPNGSRPSPARVFRFDATDLPALPKGRTSTHGGDLKEILQLADRLGRMPSESVLLAVEIVGTGPEEGLSASGQAAADALERSVLEELSIKQT
jgi:hydrogenase maturation protease